MDKLQFLSCSCKDDDLIKRSSERGDRIQKSQYYLHATLFLPLTTYGSVQDRYILSVEEQEWIPNCVLKKKKKCASVVHLCSSLYWSCLEVSAAEKYVVLVHSNVVQLWKCDCSRYRAFYQ